MAGGGFSHSFIPLFLTSLTFICILIVFLPGLGHNFPEGLFLITADTSALDTALTTQLHINSAAAQRLAWGDYVYVGLWNSCMRHAANSSTSDYIECTSPAMSFVFDPVSVWSLDGTDAEAASVLPPSLVNSLENHAIHTVSIKILLIIALALSAVGLITGITSACTSGKNHSLSRRMLYTATLSSVVDTIILLAGSALATHAYTILLGVLSPSFGDVITFSLGRGAVAMLWISNVFALLTVVSWIFALRKERKNSSYGRRLRSGARKNRQQGAYTTLEDDAVRSNPSGQNNESNFLLEQTAIVSSGENYGEKYEPYKSREVLYDERT